MTNGVGTRGVVAGGVSARRPATGKQARADRSRQALIDETIRYVLDEGFAPPSVRQIAARAGVTWGAVQYHFGDLDGVLMAVVDSGFDDLLRMLDEVAGHIPDGPAPERAAFVVDAVWQTFSTPASKAVTAILLSTRSNRTAEANARLADMARNLGEIGVRLAPGLDRGAAVALGNLIWNTIRGLVTVELLWPKPLDTAADLAMLTEVVASYLESAGGAA